MPVCVCVCVCVCVFEFVCILAGMVEWGGGGESRHDLCYILHNVILNQKSAMLCLYVCVQWLRNCVCVRVCLLVTCEALSKCHSHLY